MSTLSHRRSFHFFGQKMDDLTHQNTLRGRCSVIYSDTKKTRKCQFKNSHWETWWRSIYWIYHQRCNFYQTSQDQIFPHCTWHTTVCENLWISKFCEREEFIKLKSWLEIEHFFVFPILLDQWCMCSIFDYFSSLDIQYTICIFYRL